MKKENTTTQPRLSLLNLSELAQDAGNPKWLVEGVLLEKQPMVLGGPLKTLKTSLALDLAVSLGTGTPFLGKFASTTKKRVAVFSGESGKATVHETIQRILLSKKLSSADCTVQCGFCLPRLSRATDRKELCRLLKEEGSEVVLIDPLYLSLLAGGHNLSAANLFDVGGILAAAAKACARAGATMVLVHHTTKTASTKSATTLSDLSFAGIGEFARQWLLLKRTEEYQPGSGQHHLTLSVGGSAGHSSQWRVVIDEGKNGHLKRKWSVTIHANKGGANIYDLGASC